MGLFNKVNGGGMMDVIRCDEPSYLIWKWHPEGTAQGNNRKENGIRWGSSLRVKEGSVAVFVYNSKDGIVQDYIEGPFDAMLYTDNLPVISSVIGLAYDGNVPFQAEVYFINLAQIIQSKFVVPYFDVFDPRFLDFAVPTAVRGTISFKISDYKEFIKLHRLDNFSLDDFNNQIKDAVSKYVKSIVANAPTDYNIPVIQLERKITEINDVIESNLRARMFDDFGVTISGVDVAVIDVDKTSEGYTKLQSVTQDLAGATAKAQAQANIRDIQSNQIIGMIDKGGKVISNLATGAYAKFKQTQSENLAAYQTEAAKDIGVAGAVGLGKMGANGGGGINNPASMMAGMAVGGAVGQNIAGAMNNAMNGMNQAGTQGQQKMYNVASNGEAIGPFDMNTLAQMVVAGTLLKESLVWTKGMNDWAKAEDVNDLKSLFPEMPPIPNK